MSKILRQNVGGVDFTMAGCALTGVCATSAADYVKQITLSDGDVIEDGMLMVVTFANGNSAGNAPGTKTIYSSDQTNYFEDEQLTVPFTLAPSGCYEIEYTGTGNAYTYTDYPVFQIGSVSGPVCDYRGHVTSGALWDAGDLVQCMLKEGKFLLLGGSGGTGSGLPVGLILHTYKKITPHNCLYLDGRDTTGTAEELETHYPELYMYLGGTNVLPDYREVGLVGAEKNTTDIFDSTETDPRTGQAGTQNHDVFAQGEFKDDQVQQHLHRIDSYENGSTSFSTHVLVKPNTGLGNQDVTDTGLMFGARIGTVTRGKSKAVYYYIVAVDGTSISDDSYVVDTVKSYVDRIHTYYNLLSVSSDNPSITIDLSGYSEYNIDVCNIDMWGTSSYLTHLVSVTKTKEMSHGVMHTKVRNVAYITYALNNDILTVTYNTGSGAASITMTGTVID